MPTNAFNEIVEKISKLTTEEKRELLRLLLELEKKDEERAKKLKTDDKRK